ncbi:MAG: pyridoxal-phosphate dependent enzyme [Ferruginibacter sp.]
MLFNKEQIITQRLHDELFDRKKLSLDILRLDKIHPVVSGNKLFKLHYFLEEAQKKPGKPIITFGGAYSNHLAATAFACQQLGIPCKGIVRGEKRALLSHTLQNCLQWGMELQFISRQSYAEKDTDHFKNSLNTGFDDCITIPEGGYDTRGAAGAALIMNYIDKKATHICAAIGTATTLAGISAAADTTQKTIGIPVLKGMTDIEDRVHFLNSNSDTPRIESLNGYHFGGYAKYNNDLIDFMNKLYLGHGLPTDFVYTAKMMYAVFDLIKKDYFPPGSKIVCIHTGGLQGNLSLPANTLTF